MGISGIEVSMNRWSPDVARRLAEEVKRQWDEVGTVTPRPSGARLCRVCNDPNRVETDAALMMGAGLKTVAARYPGYDHKRVRNHFREHLIPALRGEIQVEPGLLLAIPYPQGASAEEQDTWFLGQYYAVKNLAMAPSKKDGPDLQAVIMAVDRMREVRDGTKRSRPRKPATVTPGLPALKNGKAGAEDEQTARRVSEAMARSEAGVERGNNREDFDDCGGRRRGRS